MEHNALSSTVPQAIFQLSHNYGVNASTSSLRNGNQSLLENNLIIPSDAAIVSVIVLAIQLVLQSKPVRKLYTKLANLETTSSYESTNDDSVTASSSKISRQVARLGGPVIFGFHVARFLSCLVLTALEAYTVQVYHQSKDDVHLLISEYWLHVALCLTFAYASLLALSSTLCGPSLNVIVVRHCNVVLIAALAIYSYRDVWPLATFTLSPMDGAEGALIWAKIGILAFASVVIPLSIPRRYVPFDPQDPWSSPPPEQTASLWSLMTFAWLDSTIYEAYRNPHLPLDKLPPLADYDSAQNLAKRSFRELDPFQTKRKGRHIFWGILKTFRSDFMFMAFTLVLRVISEFASPLGMRNLLRYIEKGGEDAIVRPWVWISWLVAGPFVGMIVFSGYIFTTLRLVVRLEAIITQLVFDHALRMRLKAEVDAPKATSGDETAIVTPETVPEGDDSQNPRRDGAIRDDASTATSSTADGSNSSKGKNKSSPGPSGRDSESAIGKGASAAQADTRSKNLVGRINNLVTSDLKTITDGKDFIALFVHLPLQVALCVWFLYTQLGWSAFVGLAVIILLFPIPGTIARHIRSVHAAKMKKTDARVQDVTETMTVIRMVKLFGWEGRLSQQLDGKRDEEISWIKKSKLWELLNNNLNHVIPLLTMIATFFTYGVIMRQELSASKVFSSMAVFEMFSMQLHMLFGLIPGMMRARVSLDRLNDFLNKTELLDEFAEKKDDTPLLLLETSVGNDAIGFRQAAFTWANEEDLPSTPGSMLRTFRLKVEEELQFKRGGVNLIVGPTGSGKTSMLMALLGEMHYIPSGPDSYVNLPRDRGVAYAAQESWVQNETIRDNILFGSAFDEERYNNVIYQCGLKRDLELFDAGDSTEVGERGITLSGGQQARVTLARAVYSTAEILLLDDVLAALDVHTAKWIVDKCLKGDLIRGRTVILVTHNVTMASPIAQFVVSLGTNGRVLSQGTLSNALEHDAKLAAEVADELAAIDRAEEEIDADNEDDKDKEKKPDGKLVVAEEIAVGHVGWPALKLYLASLGGKHSTLFWMSCLITILLSEFLDNTSVWFLGYWARQYEERPPFEVNALAYLSGYAAILITGVIYYSTSKIIFLFGKLRASRSIHQTLISSVLGTTLRWLDKTPTSRIITRCTQDIQAVDGNVGEYLGFLIDLTVTMAIKLIFIVVLSPVFLPAGILLAVAGGCIGQLYMKAQLSAKREQSNARAPVLGHFGAAFAGLVSIRAYGAQDAFRRESYVRINRYTRAARTYWNLNRWIGIRIEALAAVFCAALATYLVYGTSVSASNTGFSLNMAVSFSGMILWWVRIFNEFEVSGSSLERIQQYVQIEQESKPNESGVPPAYWPASGNLRVEKLSARYSEDGPQVLHEISFEARSGERVGIVGRTGSGKSSLTLALLRCMITEGKVYYDDIPTDSVNLDILRSQVTIIPQMPELLSGTLRQNLDPFGQYDDAVLNDSLRSAGLFSLQGETDEGRITLDSQIASGGGNLSVGQRQILALARAIVRQSKLLILDEATSAIDYATDAVIQTSLRRELDNGVTVLTIAHRLQTIMDSDKIMVLDAGRIVEFGPPGELLKNEKGLLRALVDESGDKASLIVMASGTGSST
ncbi:hypothetical protein WOLCODRAFT_107550 [Wolfiporia cocos MD-104 SS10]|uniref:P-loop containing nucleoside triphosphate hydrolase protein n=1 Tax=Wolfiporia cocos (strain MD-104) TaxID=742152 RepID=A0A2H3J1L7_WOLCO|nr:hypothetical protein WOLCODRAFT_107550 [Wolfiporia cocos MD-104 SS10]